MCALGLVSVGHAQQLGGGMGNIPGTAFGGATDPSALQITEGFRIIPLITVGERYDSNVFFSPKIIGFDPADMVTTVIPQVRSIYAGSLATVNARVGAIGEYYAKHSGLNYVGTNAGGSLDLSKLASSLWEGTQLTVADSYADTPHPPAFQEDALSGAGDNSLFRGLQPGRVSVRRNDLLVYLAVPLNRVVTLTGGYNNNFIKFGQSEVTQTGALFDVTQQTYTAGLLTKISSQDTISLNLISSEFDSGSRGSFTTRGGTVGWARLFTRNVTLTSAAGAQLIEGTFSGGQTAPTAASAIAPNVNLALFWKDDTTTMALTYSSRVTATFLSQSQSVLSHVVSFALTQQTAIPELLGVASFNYGTGSEFGGSSTSTQAISYTSYGGSGGGTYKFTPQTFLSLLGSYSNFDQSFGTVGSNFDRYFIQMSLSHAFY